MEFLKKRVKALIAFLFMVSVPVLADSIPKSIEGEALSLLEVELIEAARNTKCKKLLSESDDEYHICLERCTEIYEPEFDDERDVDRQCKQLTVAQIEKLEEVHENLLYADVYYLSRTMDPEYLSTYLDISLSAFINLIFDEYGEEDAKEILTWLTEENFIVDKLVKKRDGVYAHIREYTPAVSVFKKYEDSEYSILSALLEVAYPSGDVDERMHEYFTKIELDTWPNELNLMEQIIESENEIAMDWFMSFIKDKNPDCNDKPVSEYCFEVYCKIGDGIDSHYREKWVYDFEDFEKYLEKVITCFNEDDKDCRDFAPFEWTTDKEDENYIENLSDLDLNESWVDKLCEAILE